MDSKRFSAVTLFGLATALFGCAEQPVLSPGQGTASTHLYGRAEGGWFVILDNASSLENWNRVGNARWQEIEGAIQADRGRGFLVSKEHYRDFQLRAEFWIDANADSGVLFRCSNPGNVSAASCYEADINDKSLEPASGSGTVVGIARASQPVRTAGQWNVYEITATGPQVTIVLNGIRTVSGRDTRFAAGPVAIEYAGGGVVKFRRVQIRPL